MITEEKKINRKSLFKILIALILIICIIILAQFAWAKYMAKVDGQATAQIAEMKFKINGDYYKSTDEIEFASTITQQNPKVASGMLAPGTAGYIPITIDATETQTSLEYEISIDLTDRPTNLKFYSDSNKTEEILVKNDKIIRRGYISINDENSSKEKHETLYWQWLTETGENSYEINENDIEDSKFIDKLMTMQITVKGTQAKECPHYLSDNVEFGDMINYILSDGNIIQGIVVNKTINDIDFVPVRNGNLVYGGPLTLEGSEGYNQAILKIKKTAISLYKDTIAYRALTAEDVNNLTSYKPIEDYTAIKCEKKYYSGTFIVDELTMINDSIYACTLQNIKAGDKITVGDTIGDIQINNVTVCCNNNSKDTNAYYSYNIQDKVDSDIYWHTCWLASRCIDLSGSSCCYGIRGYYASSGDLGMFRLNYSNNTDNSVTLSVVPVISIPATAHTKQIIDENNTDKVIWEVTE